jgi:hydroxymethylbilane synthase
MGKTYRIGTRGSKMALAQTQKIIDELQFLEPENTYKAVVIKTTGDKFMGDLKNIGGKGLFVKEIEQALLDGKIEMAMHSMKDVPGDVDLPKGLIIPSMLKRDDLRDVAVCREGETFIGLKNGSKIGTSAPRRAAAIQNAFPYLKIVPIRGAADTRVAKLDSGEVDALIMAKSGLERIGYHHRISEVFEPDMICPAIAQGVVGIQCRKKDQDIMNLLEKINHKDTFTCVTTERILLKILQGNCHTPIAGYCEVTKGGNLRFIALVASPDGKKIVRAREKMPYSEYEVLGQKVAEILMNQGARSIINDIQKAS